MKLRQERLSLLDPQAHRKSRDFRSNALLVSLGTWWDPLPSSQHRHPPGTLTAAGLAVGVQGVAPVAAAVVAVLCVDTLVLTAWSLQCTVVDP